MLDHNLLPIRSDHDFFLFIFEGGKGEIAHLPNVVLPTGRKEFQVVSGVIGRPAGIWSEEANFDAEGNYPGTRYSVADTFRLWTLDRNREQFQRSAGVAPLSHMGIILDSEAPDSVLEGLASCRSEGPQSHLNEQWDFLVRNIEIFRWAYVTIAYEEPLAIVIARPSDQEWIKNIKTALTANHFPHTSIVSSGGKTTWNLGEGLRKLCRLDYEAASAFEWKATEPVSISLLSAEEEAIRDKLESLTSGDVLWTDAAWLLDVVTNDNLAECCRIVEAGTKDAVITAWDAVTDEGLQRMPQTGKLVSFSTGYPVTAVGIAELARQPNLRALRINEIHFGDDDLLRLKYFAVFPKLEELDLDESGLSKDDIEHIQSVDSIKTLIVGLKCIKGDVIWCDKGVR